MNRFLFGYGSPVTLGVLRILLSSLCFFNALILAGLYHDFYTESGFVPGKAQTAFDPGPSRTFDFFGKRATLPFSPPTLVPIPNTPPEKTGLAPFDAFQKFLYANSDSIDAGLLGVLIVSSVLGAIGLWTRPSVIVMALSLFALHHRNAMILNGGDTLLRVMLLYLAVSPCGEACSIDRLRALARGAPAENLRVSLWPQRLIQLNLAILYVTTVWLKLGGASWRNGSATWYTTHLAEFSRFPVPDFFRSESMMYFNTYATLGVELAMGTLVFSRPLRKWVLLSGVLLHATIDYTMNIPFFGLIICSGYLAFYDGEEITAWARRVGAFFARFRATIAVPEGSRLARFLIAADPFGLLRIEESTEKPGAPSILLAARANPFLLLFRMAWARMESR